MIQFPCSICHKSIGDKKNAIFLIYVNYGFTLNVITSIVLIVNIYQDVINLGIALVVTLKYMLLAI